jgi:hypothetical protein
MRFLVCFAGLCWFKPISKVDPRRVAPVRWDRAHLRESAPCDRRLANLDVKRLLTPQHAEVLQGWQRDADKIGTGGPKSR